MVGRVVSVISPKYQFRVLTCAVCDHRDEGDRGVKEAKTTNKSDPKNVKLVHLHHGGDVEASEAKAQV